ncbi:MAG TPA: aminotransferase class V-fold PLP-dependent enzyme [Candidatus Paceibacterota bacterium]|nr:aminotransferase class V-fold PLP-dependent enzyme [Candidatus Paceibacterota bacterium]
MFWNKRVYLDVAAAFPVRPEAARAFTRAAALFGNPSSPHEEGRVAKEALEQARTAIARLTEVKSDDIIFTSGATEANAIAILGSVHAGDHALYLPSAHASIVENMRLLPKCGVTIEPLPVHDGRVDAEALKRMLRPETKLVSMDAVCGETGTIWNTREVHGVLVNHAPQAHLHVDASQAALSEKILRAHFSADLLTFDAAKVGGMRGVGCLIAHRTIPLTALYRGGGQEREVRPGTESPALAAAFAAALTASVAERELFRARAVHDRALLTTFITTHCLDVCINAGKETVPHILNISFPGRDTDYLVALLDEAGYAVSTRSACETDSADGSRAVFVLCGDAERATSTLRISWHAGNNSTELRRFGHALVRAVRVIDNASR